MRLRVLVVAVVASLWGPVRAERLLVLESHVGARSPADARVLSPAITELRARGATTDAQAAARIVERLGGDGELDEQRIQAAVGAVESAHDHFSEGKFPEAVRLLTPAIADLQSSPATFARRPELRTQLRRGLVVLALAHHRLRAANAATAAMAEVVRTFGDEPFDRASFGPEPFTLYQSVAANLRSLAPGQLRVAVTDEAATILVNERFAGVGSVTLGKLIPGRYRIYAQKGDRRGRLHTVDVAAGGTTELGIDWVLDASVRTDARSAELVFADAGQLVAEEATRATQTARLLGMDGVIVLRVIAEDGRRFVVGTRYSLDTARPLRSARVSMEPTPPHASVLVSLSRFLVGEPPAGELEVLAPRTIGPKLLPAPPRSTERRRHGGWKWLALGAGAAAVATGIYLLAIDGPIKDENGDFTPEQYETATPGAVTIVAGGALMATGVVLWWTERF